MARPQFTIGRLMGLVAIVALLLVLIPGILERVSKPFRSFEFGLFLVLVSFAMVLINDVVARETRLARPQTLDREEAATFTRQILAATAIISVVAGSLMMGYNLRGYWDHYKVWHLACRSELGRYQTRRQTCLGYIKQLEAGRQQELELLRAAESEKNAQLAGTLRERIKLRDQAIRRFSQKADEEDQMVGQYERKVQYPWWSFLVE